MGPVQECVDGRVCRSWRWPIHSTESRFLDQDLLKKWLLRQPDRVVQQDEARLRDTDNLTPWLRFGETEGRGNIPSPFHSQRRTGF